MSRDQFTRWLKCWQVDAVRKMHMDICFSPCPPCLPHPQEFQKLSGNVLPPSIQNYASKDCSIRNIGYIHLPKFTLSHKWFATMLHHGCVTYMDSPNKVHVSNKVCVSHVYSLVVGSSYRVANPPHNLTPTLPNQNLLGTSLSSRKKPATD